MRWMYSAATVNTTAVLRSVCPCVLGHSVHSHTHIFETLPCPHKKNLGVFKSHHHHTVNGQHSETIRVILSVFNQRYFHTWAPSFSNSGSARSVMRKPEVYI